MEFEDVKCDDRSSVWRHFLRARDKNSAKCKECNKILKCVGGSTSGLHKHLKNVHELRGEEHGKDLSNQLHQESGNPSTSRKRKISDYFESSTNPSMETMISRMVALDGMPFRVLANSDDQRLLFQKVGHKLPKSANSIRALVFEQYHQKKKELMQEIEKLKANKEKFAISFDEWTSSRNRRYLSLILHSQGFSASANFKNLGLIRIYGSLPAEKCIELIKEKLASYGLSLEHDIIASTTDGCSMMVKVGRLLKSIHQKCIAHAIQLAISDVFYKKTKPDFVREDEIPLAELTQGLEINPESSDKNCDEEDGIFFFEDIQDLRDGEEFEYHDLISKVRNVVKIFNKSPTKNDDILQKYVKADFGKEYHLIIDIKTRWSSIADMLARFLKLKTCVTKSLLDINSKISFSEEEWDQLHDIHEVLDVIKTIVESLCRRDASLLTADVAVKYALKKFTEMNSLLSNKMAMHLKQRYSERRLIEAATLTYLTNPCKYFEDARTDDVSIFIRPTSSEMCDNIIKLLNLSSDETIRSECIEQFRQEEHEECLENRNVTPLTKQDELEMELKKATTSYDATAASRIDSYGDIGTTIKIEMALFENGGDRGHFLSLAYKYLSSIPPTSVEPERIFSAAGFICNRLRSSLSDQSLDVISFLRSYYIEKRRYK
ncbi:hypothetical protein ABMA28_006673 [Loxostege sticticalis]|uniref:BED-type domain-containing protein n=1 Tax=Loxostege sticticalis TaxID=481309 RepID=A0ABD0TNE0_LOXSC